MIYFLNHNLPDERDVDLLLNVNLLVVVRTCLNELIMLIERAAPFTNTRRYGQYQTMRLSKIRRPLAK